MNVFNELFMQYALCAGIIAGGLLSFLGVYVVLRRIVFVGIALSEIAALGIALGFFFGINPEISSIMLTLLGIVFFWAPFQERKISRESIIGFSYCLAAALIILIISKSPMIEAAGIDLISGNLLYVSGKDIIVLSVFAIFTLAVQLLFFKKILFCSFDKETAQALGLKANTYDFIFYLTVGLTIAFCVRIAGVLFVFGSLIIPPMIALSCFRRIKAIFSFSVIVAMISVLSGLVISYYADLPSSPTIVAMYSILFILASSINFIKSKY